MNKIRSLNTFFLLFIIISITATACHTKRSSKTSHITQMETAKDSAPTAYNIDVHAIPDAIPRPETRSRYGNPASYVVFGKRYHVLPSSEGYYARGIASWYGTKFHQKRTSSGEPYDMFAMTAAHTSLPLPTYVRVTNLRNNRSVVVKVNDRGPFHDKRIIDLSYAAAKKLDVTTHGTDLVEIVALNPHSTPTSPSSSPPKEQHYVEKPRGGVSGIFLQVGVFAEKGNAERIANQIRQLTNKPVQIKQNPQGRKLYRVHIGPLAPTQAENVYALLTEAGFEAPVPIST